MLILVGCSDISKSGCIDNPLVVIVFSGPVGSRPSVVVIYSRFPVPNDVTITNLHHDYDVIYFTY